MAPRDKDVIVHDGQIMLQGWSYSGGGNWVERVEVSPDGYVMHGFTLDLNSSFGTAGMSGTLLNHQT